MNQEQQHLLNKQLTNTLIKLEREAERHRGERQYHIRRTNILAKITVVILLLLGAFNVYYIWGFYDRTQMIVNTITDMGTDVTVVANSMVHLTATMEMFDAHVSHMPGISSSTLAISGRMPAMNQSLGEMLGSMGEINRNMSVMSGDVVEINQRFGNITRGINVMGSNVHAIAGPMGSLNSFMP